MHTYAQTLIDEYNRESSQYYPSRPSNLAFYPNGSYNITFYSSSQYGSALRFEQSSVPSFQTIYTFERIEIAVFGGDYNVGGLVGLNNSNDIMFAGVSLINWGDRSVLRLVNENTSAIFENLSVNRTSSYQFYHLVIIKGSNQTSEWTSELAKSEASGILYGDTGYSFPQSAEFIRLYGESVLTQLLQAIQNRLPESNYTFSEYLADLQMVKNVAGQYNITSEYVNEIIGFLNAKITGILPTFPPEPTPTPPIKTIFNRPVNDPDNWLYVACLGGLPVLDFAFFLFIDYWRKKRPSKLAKWALLIPPFVLSPILIDLLYYYPYDYQILSAQSLVIVVLWVLGPILLFKGEKRLSRWLVIKQKASKQTQKNPNQKAEKTSKTKVVN